MILLTNIANTIFTIARKFEDSMAAFNPMRGIKNM